MSRSFYVDSLIVKDSGVSGRSLPEPPQAPPGQELLIPLGMPPALMPPCPSRKSGSFCLCPLCVGPHLPILKGHFPAGGGDARFCPRLAPQQQHPQQQPLAQHQEHQPSALGHPPVCTAAAYSLSDPRRFHCLGMGKQHPWVPPGRVESR